MVDIITLQNSYAQLLTLIISKLASIVEKLESEWKDAQQEYQNETSVLKNFEQEKKRIKEMEADVETEASFAWQMSQKLSKVDFSIRPEPERPALISDRNELSGLLDATTRQFFSDFNNLKAQLDTTVKQVETTLAIEAKSAKEKADLLKKEQKRLANWMTYLQKEVPIEPAEVRRAMFQPLTPGKAIKRIKYKSVDIDGLIAIIKETRTLLQQRFFTPPGIIARRTASSMLDYVKGQIDSILQKTAQFRQNTDKIEKRIEQFAVRVQKTGLPPKVGKQPPTK